MNKKLIIITLVITGILGAGGIFLLNSKQLETKDDDSLMINDKEKDEAMMKDKDQTEEMINTNSQYVEYSKSNLENAEGKRVLFFYASWCPTCRPADKNFKENLNKFPKDLTLIRVNYNDPETDQEEKDLAKKYVVTYQHTYVQIDESGKEITRWNGGQFDELMTNIK